MIASALIAPLFALGALAQTGPWTDPNSGIALQTHFTGWGVSWGIVLPPSPQSDFIGQIVGDGKGWSGIALRGYKLHSLLVVAWPHETSLVSSLRLRESDSSQPVATGNYTIKPIPSGTYVNETHYSITFLCAGCIQADGSTFAATDKVGVFGWAWSTAPPLTPSDSATSFHEHDTSLSFALDLTSAKSEKYATWAALAE